MRYAIHAPACFSKPPSHTQSERPSLRSGPALCPGQAYFLLSPGQYESNWQSRQVSSCLNIELAQMHWSRDVAPGSERLFAVQGCMSLCPGHRTDVQDRAKCTPAHVPGSAEGARKRVKEAEGRAWTVRSNQRSSNTLYCRVNERMNNEMRRDSCSSSLINFVLNLSKLFLMNCRMSSS